MYRTALVTGASGWVGRNGLDLLGTRGPGFAESLVVSARRSADINIGTSCPSAVETLALGDLVLAGRSLVMHAAYPTQEQVTAAGEVAYLRAIDELRAVVVRMVRAHGGDLDLVYLSSGAARVVEQAVPAPHRTRVYGGAKVRDEEVLAREIEASGGRLCVVRAFALSGPYMTKPETYALGNMIFQALDTGTVEVKATRPVRRSYMAIDDMLNIAIHAVGELEAGQSITFETAGEVVEMGDLASRVLAVLGCDRNAVVRSGFNPEAPPDDYLGDPGVVGELAARAGVVPASLDEQIAVTAEWLKRNRAS